MLGQATPFEEKHLLIGEKRMGKHPRILLTWLTLSEQEGVSLATRS